MPDVLDRQLTLADGRALAYRDVGDRDAPAVVFNPGFMGCRLTGPATPGVGVRVVTPDRPGIGRSDPKPGRRLLDWPADVAALADHLGLDRFAVLGHSAGGPYALASAHLLGSRITTVGVACGFAPFDRPDATVGMNPRMARAAPGLRRAPWMARLFANSLPRQYRRDPERAFQRQFGRDLPPTDAAALAANHEARRVLLDAAVEATRQGTAPLATEMQLTFARPWGFDPAAITTPTRLWYGADDTLTPAPMGQFLHQAIRDSELTVEPAHGHMLLFETWAEIITALVEPPSTRA